MVFWNNWYFRAILAHNYQLFSIKPSLFDNYDYFTYSVKVSAENNHKIAFISVCDFRKWL